ncbi:MAG: TetR/AcrR family transcriptional regulator [Alphaproteobacteria bacterium]
MRTPGSDGKKTRQAIRKASLDLIYRKGFTGASLRDIANKIGMQPASLYNYIKNKEDLLYFICRETAETRLDEVTRRLADAPSDPISQLAGFVRYSVEINSTYRKETSIGRNELRRLTGARYRGVVRLRDRYDAVLHKILADGSATGAFTIPDPHIAALAILGLCIGISRWYHPRGRLSPDDLADLYVGMTMDIVHAAGTKSARPGGRPPAAGARTRR